MAPVPPEFGFFPDGYSLIEPNSVPDYKLIRPKYTPEATPAIKVPDWMFNNPYTDFADSQKEALALRAQELINQNYQTTQQSNELKLAEQQRAQQEEDARRNAIIEEYGARDPSQPFDMDNAFARAQELAFSQGDLATGLAIEKARQEQGQNKVLSPADRAFASSMGLDVPEGTTARVFGTLGNLMNSGIVQPNISTPLSPGTPGDPNIPTSAMVEGSLDPYGKNVITQIDINKIPVKMRSKAMAEAGILQGLDKIKNVIASVFDDYANTGTVGRITSLTGTKGTADKANIETSIMSIWKGPMSKTDRDSVSGFFPSFYDGPEAIAAKKRGLLQFIEQNAQTTPILDKFNPGLRKRQVWEDLPTPGNFNQSASPQNIPPEVAAQLPPGLKITGIRRIK